MDNVDLGSTAEELACNRLRQAGYRIVARNWRMRLGEIDIVARDGDVLAFVEVKARSSAGFGGPEGAVGPRKRRRIVAAASAFLAATNCDLASRFDVVAVEDGDVRIVRDAFQADDVRPAV